MTMECCSSVITLEREELLLQNNNSIKQELNSGRQEQTPCINSSHAVRAFQVLHSLRKDEVLCDIKLETDDGTIVYGHKVILASATPYFLTMFTNFEESKKEHIILHELSSTALKLIVDFIYTAQIMVTEDNVRDLLHAANLLQLHDVEEACCNFLQFQLNPTNCLGFKELVSFYGCEGLSSFESYIQQNFLEVIESNEFLCLPYEQVIELISSNSLNVPSEEKVFECVISWMNHNSDCQKDVLPKLMEHVRLPLTSKEYLLNRVKEEPLLKNSLECKDYIIEALDFHRFMYEQPNIIPKTIRTKPRQNGSNKNILVVGCLFSTEPFIYTEWYDPATKKWQLGHKIRIPQLKPTIAALNDRLLFLLDCSNSSIILNHVYTLDLFSQSLCLNKTVPMLKYRRSVGVGVIDNCIYVVGGTSPNNLIIKDGEVFNFCTQKWQMISEMSTPRYSLGIGVLNNHLYAIGGIESHNSSMPKLRSVERYCPTSCKWTLVADMLLQRCDVGIGVLNGVMYAVGGRDGFSIHRSVEVYNPSSNVWTFVSDMHKCRKNPGVVVLDGLLYVVGGDDEASVEIYNPKTNMWSMLSAVMNIKISIGAFAIKKYPNFNT